MPCFTRTLWLSVVASISAPHVAAQCSITAFPSEQCSGVVGGISSLGVWDQDGPGPAPTQLLVAGSFRVAGDVVANSVVAWDLVSQTWSPLGAGLPETYSHAASAITMPNGDLMVGGRFGQAGGVAASGVASWNGQSWSALGPGLVVSTSGIRAMSTLPNGDLIVAGQIYWPASPWSGIARWNGTAWSELPGLQGDVYCLAVEANGDLVAAGKFGLNGATHVYSIARWNGSTWVALASGLDNSVECLQVLPNGDLVAGGFFTTIAGVAANYVARWDGTAWSSMAGGMNGAVAALTVLSNGDLVAGGRFTIAGGLIANFAARWNGATWAALGGGPGWRVGTFAVLPNGDVLAGRGGGSVLWGSGESIDSVAEIARWNGTAWSLLTPGGLSDFAEALAVMPNGEVVVGGRFSRANGIAANRVARWDGSTLSPLGLGMDDRVFHLLPMPNGDLIAAGIFTTAGGVPADGLARWDGSSWSALGASSYQYGQPLVVLPNGDLLTGTDVAPFLQRWNGTTWAPIVPGPTRAVGSMAVLPNGDLIVAHRSVFSWPPLPPVLPSIERWDGSAWSLLGTANGACGVRVLSNGDLIVLGSFTMIDNVAAPGMARWNGTTWTPLVGINGLHLLAVLPNGDMVGAGTFSTAGGAPANNLARWNGTTWSAIGTGTNSWVGGLLALPNGDLLIAGSFTIADQQVSPYLARLSTTCPAAAMTSGLGCPSSGGSNTLIATTLPWVDATFRAQGTGLPNLAFVVAVTSLMPIAQSALPLDSVFAEALSGCDLLVAPDILQLYATTNGSLESSFFLPNTPPIVGTTFFHQLVPAEVDAAGNVVAVTATNSLLLTAGSF